MLQQLMELVRRKNIFRWDLKRVEIKLIAVVLYYAGISFRKTSKFLRDLERFSHESVRIWYHKVANLFANTRKDRRCIAIDETKVRIGNKYWYIWAAIDVDGWEIVGVMVTEWRTSIDVIRFVRDILRYCENKPIIKTDRGPWYRWTLQRMGLKHEYETFGERNAIEGWFNLLKSRLKRFWKRFPSNASKESVESWITAFVTLYNLEVRIS
jgi:transposase-like protein